MESTHTKDALPRANLNIDWKRLEDALSKFGELQEPEGFTKAEFVQKYNLSPSSAQRKLLKLVEAGVLEAKTYKKKHYYTFVEDK